MKNNRALWYFSRFVILMLLYIIFFVAGSLAVDSLIPDLPSEPGMVSPEVGLLIMGALNAILIIVLIESSRYRGWKLAFGLAFAYYGAVTFIMQIETWYFLTSVTVSEELLPRLFIMGLPVPLFFIPLAILLLGKAKAGSDSATMLEPVKPLKEWAYKPILIAVAYILLYWFAGYFIAWQNPELRAFYGSPGDALPFWQHTINTLRNEPGLFLFQALRGLLWALFALPVLLGVLAVLLLKRHRPLGHRLNTIGLALSLTYLILACGTGEFVKRRVTEKLAHQEVPYFQFISSPAPFTTLLWRVVGIDNDRYFETYYSLFDGEAPLFINFYARNLNLMTGIEEHPPVVKLERFTMGYFAFSTEGGYVAMTDLRMGSEPNYVFRFKVARLDDPHPMPIDDERLKMTQDWRGLAWVWRRIWNPLPQF